MTAPLHWLVGGSRKPLLAAAALACVPWPLAAGAACPKVLMFDGIDMRTAATAAQADYWGRTIGIQGVFLNNVMASWPVDVGTDPDSPLWQQAEQFQSAYARAGVTDNFIKVALYHAHDWRSASQNAAAVEHFAHAAALARYAGFKGIALDMEPYTPTWGGSAADRTLSDTVLAEGRAIAKAMHAAYPGMTLIVLPDVLSEIQHQRASLVQRFKSGYHRLRTDSGARHESYALAPDFLRGLLSAPWRQVVIGMEQTYNRNADGIATSVPRDYQRYVEFDAQGGQSAANLGMAPGLWPLGPRKGDRSARESPRRFAERLGAAFGASQSYVWIYGKGGTWRADRPATDPVAADFQLFVGGIHAARAACADTSAAGRSAPGKTGP